MMRRLTGIGVSPGVVSGRAVILIQRGQALRYRLSPARVAEELARLDLSRERARQQLVEIRGRVARRHGREVASIFDAQLLMLDDPMLVPRAADLVRRDLVNAQWAIQQVFDDFSKVFDEVADPYLRERKGDVSDLVGRLTMNLREGVSAPRDLFREIDEASVLIADELTPSLAAQVDWSLVRGFATDAGSRTYHTAILVRSFDVPAVVGLHDASSIVQPGQLVVIDGSAGEVLLDPSDEVLARAARQTDDRQPALHVEPTKPAATADGVRIRIEANIEFADDLVSARYAGAEGVGLFRSEFPLKSGAVNAADEEQQFELYRQLVEGMAPAVVTIRTFDVDEDQVTPQKGEGTPGWAPEPSRAGRQSLRGVRWSLARPELFRVQLRALLRAAAHGRLRIMFPFVSSVEQLRSAMRIVKEARTELEGRGLTTPRVPIGVMIEIPAAAYTADLLAAEVDFFTLGTNDLIQYCLAVDRADERVSRLYEPLHPAILRMIVMVVRAARRRRIPVSLCGEMASDPALLPLLVGLGLTEFSMTPGAIPLARQVLGETNSRELRGLARRVLRLATVAEIERELLTTLGRPSGAPR